MIIILLIDYTNYWESLLLFEFFGYTANETLLITNTCCSLSMSILFCVYTQRKSNRREAKQKQQHAACSLPIRQTITLSSTVPYHQKTGGTNPAASDSSRLSLQIDSRETERRDHRDKRQTGSKIELCS